MTTRKKVTDKVKPAAKRARKKASPKSMKEASPQQDLLGDSAPVEPVKADPEESVRALEVEPGLPTGEVVCAQPEPLSPDPTDATAAPPEESPAPTERVDSGQNLVGGAAPSWLLVTNHMNMLYMLAAGMVMGPAGFGGKHYGDPSSEVPGHIPVFRDSCPDTAVQQSISEKRHLRACIADIDLTGTEGPVHLVSREGVVARGSMPLDVDSSTALLLLPAPLPVSRINRLVFRSATDLKEFEAGVRSVANIDLDGLNTEVDEQLFVRTTSAVWPLSDRTQGFSQAVIDQPPARGAAVGGVLAMLYQLANRSELCCSSYRIASGAGARSDLEVVQADPVLAELESWINGGSPRPEASVQALLYWGAVQALVDARYGGSRRGSVDVVLDFLESQVPGLQKTDHRSRLERLIFDMRSTFGLGGGTISRLFEQHKGTLSRPLLLLCLREHCVDLLEFSHPDLGDEELVLAAILFGVRDGWGGLPVGLREPEGLSRFVEHRMFEAETSQRSARLSLASVPSRPVPLRELLAASKSDWGKTRRPSVVELVTRIGWHDCLVSRIRLPLGQCRMNIAEGGAEIVVRGIVETPVVEVDRAGLLKRVSQWPLLSPGVENELRVALASGSQS